MWEPRGSCVITSYSIHYTKLYDLVGACAALWIVAVSAEWRREVAIASSGHLGELILAGVLLYMALSGVGGRIPEIERPLGAFAAFFA